jgi:hypothetical protein
MPDQLESNAESAREQRRSPRFRYIGVIFVSWIGPRGRNHVMGRCLDISEGGLGIEIASYISADTEVRVRAEWANLDGEARVRHVTNEGGVFHLGLELREPFSPEVVAKIAEPDPA